MIKHLYQFASSKPRASWVLFTLCFALTSFWLYCYGIYLDTDESNLALVSLGAILSLILVLASLLLSLIFFSKRPAIQIGRQVFNFYFLFVACLVAGIFAAGLPVVAVYAINPEAIFVKGYWACFVLPFLFFLFETVALIGIALRARAMSAPEQEQPLVDQPDKVNRFMPIFLSTFFLLVAAQYCFARIDFINNFFTWLPTKILYRAMVFVYLGVYGFLLKKVNHLHVNMPWFVGMVVLLVSYFFVFSFVPLSFSYSYQGSQFSANGSTNYVFQTIGWYGILIMLGRFAGAAFIFLFLISFVRPSIHNRASVIWPMVTVVGLSMIFCFYSYIAEFKSYLAYFQGAEVRATIISITHSKNAFGIFLFLGCFASAFLLKYVKKWNWIFIITFLLCLATALISGCYTAVVPVVIFAIVLLIDFFINLIRTPKRKALGIVLLSLMGTVFAALVICIYTPEIRNSNLRFTSVFIRLYNRLNSIGSTEIASRTGLWTQGVSVLNGPFVFFGKTDQIANLEVAIVQTISGDNNVTPEDFHSAFLSFYSAHGLLGLVIYLAVHAWVIARLMKIHRYDPKLSVFLLILLGGAILFSIPETYTLFISMSAATMPISFLFLCDIDFLRKEAAGVTSSTNASPIKRKEANS